MYDAIFVKVLQLILFLCWQTGTAVGIAHHGASEDHCHIDKQGGTRCHSVAQLLEISA